MRLLKAHKLIIATLIIIGVMLPMSGCTTVEAKTPGQQYFALKQDYATILTAATEYSKECRKAPTDTCKKVVKEAQDIDTQVAAAIKLADSAMVEKDDSKLSGYIDMIKSGISKLKGLFK